MDTESSQLLPGQPPATSRPWTLALSALSIFVVTGANKALFAFLTTAVTPLGIGTLSIGISYGLQMLGNLVTALLFAAAISKWLGNFNALLESSRSGRGWLGLYLAKARRI